MHCSCAKDTFSCVRSKGGLKRRKKREVACKIKTIYHYVYPQVFANLALRIEPWIPRASSETSVKRIESSVLAHLFAWLLGTSHMRFRVCA